MDNQDDRRQNGLPFLNNLPWVGGFFRERQHFTTKKELIILLTPRIWNPRSPQELGQPNHKILPPSCEEPALRGW